MPQLRGKVVSGESPVEGAYVKVVGPSGDFVGERRTSDSGTFRFNLTTGRWTLSWQLPGGVKGSKDVDLGESEVEEVISI
jgi:hypothetical protein